MEKTNGTFVISLDFELMWGMTDRDSEGYKPNVAGVREAIPAMLGLFEQYQIHATWSTVGMLAHANRDALDAHVPAKELQPQYADATQSTYAYIAAGHVGEDEASDVYHYGDTLLRQIIATPHQYIGSHTFSHLYALDVSEDEHVLQADIDAACVAFGVYGVAPGSLVFPRNQVSPAYMSLAQQSGISVYRGNEDHHIYHPRKDTKQSRRIRALRLLDAYINITGFHTYVLKPGQANVPASRFLRPYMPRLRILEPLRLRRIKNAMTYAAKHGEVFHLWWHPHNFGTHLEENCAMLVQILEHYALLEQQYGMESKAMEECIV